MAQSDYKDYPSVDPETYFGNNFQTTQTTTNPNNTVSTTILDEFRVEDNNADGTPTQRYSSAPETSTAPKDSNTGSGLEAALGTDYSWDTNAEERANLSYKSAVLDAKANYLTNRQQLESQGQEFQEQVDMQKYSQNQSNEKTGWTGGYVLDRERQMEYLKQTIQSQMYGQMELQKYGYDTSLAAARLAYDTNKYDLALEYYNTALQRAITEAEITGYYISPEVSEMLNEYSIASKILNDGQANDEDKLRADKVLSSVYNWFEANGISKQGVETYSHIVEERTHKMSIDSIYEYVNDAQNQISTDTFVKLDENGNKIYTDTGVETLDFSKMTAQKILDYTNTSEAAKDQYLSRLDSIAYEMENSFKTWCAGQSDLVKEDGSLDTTKDYISAFKSYIENSDFTDKIANEIKRLLPEGSSETLKTGVENLISGWSVDIELPNGETKTLIASIDKRSVQNEPINLLETGTKSITIKKADGTSETIDVNYLKDANNITDLMQGLNTEEVKPMLDMMLTIDFSSETAFAESVANWQQYAKLSDGSDIPCVSSFLNIVNAGTDILSYIPELIGDQAQADKYKNQANLLTGIKQSFNDILGTENMKLIKDAAKRYNSLSEKDRANMMETKTNEDGTTEKIPNEELTALQNSTKIIAQLNTIDSAIKYAKDHDSGMFTDSWDYIADSWKTTAENWNDGYQFGDVTRTAYNAVENVVTTVASALIGGFKWLFGIK